MRTVMKRAIELTPLRNMPPLSFEYDDETGTITGRDAQLAGEIIADAERARFVAIEPHPSSHRLGPTPHAAADLAAIFGQWYTLPDWLEAVRPRGEPEADDDERDVELSY
jgi:hypothetical protein